jgi:hypothetical protein
MKNNGVPIGISAHPRSLGKVAQLLPSPAVIACQREYDLLKYFADTKLASVVLL